MATNWGSVFQRPKKLVAGGTYVRDNLADGLDNCLRLFVRDAETGIRHNDLSALRGEVRQLRLQLMNPNLEKYGSLFCLSWIGIIELLGGSEHDQRPVTDIPCRAHLGYVFLERA